MDVRQLIFLGLKASIPLTVFGFGLQASNGDLRYLFRRRSLFARSLVAMFLIMPIVAVVLGRMFDLRPEVEIALVALAITPVPPLLPQREEKAGGRASYALGLTATMAALSIVVVPLALAVLGRYFSRPFSIAPAAVARMVLMAALLPLIAGVAVRAISPDTAQRLGRPVALIARLLLTGSLLAILGSSLPTIWRLVEDGTVFALTVFLVVGLVVGHLLARPELEDRIVLAILTACRHPGIAVAVGVAVFPGERLGATLLLYLVVGALVCIPYLAWQRRQLPRPAPAT